MPVFSNKIITKITSIQNIFYNLYNPYIPTPINNPIKHYNNLNNKITTSKLIYLLKCSYTTQINLHPVSLTCYFKITIRINNNYNKQHTFFNKHNKYSYNKLIILLLINYYKLVFKILLKIMSKLKICYVMLGCWWGRLEMGRGGWGCWRGGGVKWGSGWMGIGWGCFNIWEIIV